MEHTGPWDTGPRGRDRVDDRLDDIMLLHAPATSRPVTRLLAAWGGGDEDALQQLIPLVHRELRGLARRAMLRERGDHTLQPTALVNEVYLRLVDIGQVQWNNRAHFFALSARLMRRILVDLARSQRYLKRGGGAQTIEFVDEQFVPPLHQENDLEALDDALHALAAIDPRRSQVVELRFFGGLDVDETAAVLNVSRRTVLRDWALARSWLFRELRRPAP
jgi:RNA polymerase sigma-70 factor (ECF subfamily)